MPMVRVPLSEQEEAHLALILQLHAEEIERANVKKAMRMGPLVLAKAIPDGTTVNVLARANGEPAYLTYDAPDLPRVPAPAVKAVHAGPQAPDAPSTREINAQRLDGAATGA